MDLLTGYMDCHVCCLQESVVSDLTTHCEPAGVMTLVLPMTVSVPYRQIRAHYDHETITVYQAYSAAIAIPAVKAQKLSASPEYKLGRMTWIKPSWCWMMYRQNFSLASCIALIKRSFFSRYRSGYASKDANQAHILAIKMKHEHFLQLLSNASVTHGKMTDEEKSKLVRVQWDPERSPLLELLPYRSIQIGISKELTEKWVEEWIVAIEDVTEKAKGLKRVVVEEKPGSTLEELFEQGVMPREEVYKLPENIRDILKMDEPR